MGKATFEKKSRLENQTEIRVQRKNWSGQQSDLPANEIPNSASRELVNAVALKEILVPRDGMQQVVSFAITGTFTEYTSSKTGSTVTMTGHTATSANVGKWIVYTGGDEPDLITAVAGANSYTVSSSHAVTSGNAYIRPPVNGWIRHERLNAYIIHLGASLYYVNSSYTWTEIVQTSGTSITNAQSRICEMGDHAIIFCAGMFKLDLTNYRYWICNTEPGSNTIAQAGYPLSGYFRRYLYSMTRMTGTTPLWFDHSALTIQQESGSNLQNSNNIDYQEVYSVLTPVGDTTTTYLVLVCGASPVLATLAGSNRFFDVTVDGTLYTIQYSVSSGATHQQVAAAIQANMQSVIADTCRCIYASSVYTLRNYSPSSTITVLSTPAAVTGWTDVSGALKGDTGNGTATPTGYYTQGALKYFTTPSNWKQFTHYSIYQTRQLQKDGGEIIGNPSAYAWMTDYPIMHVGKGSTSAATITLTTGKFVLFDLGAYVTVMYDSGGGVWVTKQAQITSYTSNTVAVTDETLGTHAAVYVFIGAAWGFEANIASGVVTVTTWLETWNTAEDYTAAETEQTVSVGDPVFCQNGNVYWITAKTDNTHFTINDLTVTGTAMIAGFTPKTGTSGNYPNATKDQVNDDVVSSRIGTLGLRTRFYRAMANSSEGVVTGGFVCTGYQNKFYWNDIATDRQYMIGNNHPTYQVETIEDSINALVVNSNYITIFGKKTWVTQTNLDLKYTDLNNGNVIYTLPKPVCVNTKLGVDSGNHICQFDSGIICVNQDRGVRVWDGTRYKENIILNKIQDKIKALYSSFIVGYDIDYGVLIFGSTVSATRRYDKVYAISIDQELTIGCSEFQNLAYPDLNCKPIIISTRASWLALGVTTGRWADKKIATWLRGSVIDVPDSTAPNTGYDIPGYFITGDDESSDHSAKIRFLEGGLSVSGRDAYDEVQAAATISVTAYKDNGNSFTTLLSLTTHPLYNAPISLDERLEAHRIRWKVAWAAAYAVINSFTCYYVSYDKAGSLTDRLTSEHTYQSNLGTTRLWVSIGTPLINKTSGLRIAVSGTLTRATGPDSVTTSGLVTT